MALAITHTFVSEKRDTSDSSLIRPSNWNAVHTITGTVADSELVFTDITTNNVSTIKHGFVPKLPNDVTKFLNGIGTFTVPAGSGGGNSINNVSPSTTPTFDCSLGNIHVFTLTDDTTATVTNFNEADRILFVITQSSEGSKTFTWSGNVINGMTIATAGNTINIQEFVSTDGTTLYPITDGNTINIDPE